MQCIISLWKYWKPPSLRDFWCCRCLCTQTENVQIEPARHVLCKCTVVLHCDKCPEQQDFLLFCAVTLRDGNAKPVAANLLCRSKVRAQFSAKGRLEQALESMGALSAAPARLWGSWKQGYSVWGAQALPHFLRPLRRSAQNNQVGVLAYKSRQNLCSSQSLTADTGKAAFISSK